MSLPKISIGLPVFNGERFVEQAIQSILGQTFADFELIVSDNASQDASPSICKRWAAADSRVQFHQQAVNVGAARNFNHLVSLASGNYFKWAAADDLLEPTFLERCLEVLEKDPLAVLCYAQTRIINEDGSFHKDYEDGFKLQEPAPDRRLRQFFAAPPLCNPVFGLIRTENLRMTACIGGYSSSDRVLLGELALHGTFREVPERLFLRRVHPEKSTIANPTELEFGVWFNPALRGKIAFPHWRRFTEYLKAVGRAPLKPLERLRCYAVILRFAVVPGRWAGLLGDFARIIPGVGQASVNSPKATVVDQDQNRSRNP